MLFKIFGFINSQLYIVPTINIYLSFSEMQLMKNERLGLNTLLTTIKIRI